MRRIVGMLVLASSLGACGTTSPDLPDEIYPHAVQMREQALFCVNQREISPQEGQEAMQFINMRMSGYIVNTQKVQQVLAEHGPSIRAALAQLSAPEQRRLCQQVVAANARERQQIQHNAQMAALQAQSDAANAVAISSIVASTRPVTYPTYSAPLVQPAPLYGQPRNFTYCRQATSMMTSCW